ncbi:MAG: prephenate/arogenate dehydrogenase family protein, partial [Alsobacter sp.]
MTDRLGSPLAEPLFDRILIVGLGLIGSSMARAARRMNLARVVVAADASPAVRARVAELGLADVV